MVKHIYVLLVTATWLKIRVSQELCNDADPLKATKTKSIEIFPNGIQECQAEAKKLENKNANFIVFLLRADTSGNNCFIYENCDEKNSKRNLPGVSFQRRRTVS